MTGSARPFASTIGLAFGGLWGVLGAQALPAPWPLPAVIVSGLVSLGLAARLWLRPSPPDGSQAMFGRRAYIVAVLCELAAIFAASAVLPRFGLQGYLVEVVGVIVGLHFIGLWKATSARRFLFIAAGMCAVSLAAMLAPHGPSEIDMRSVAAGFGNALVLWLGAGSPAQRARA